MGLSESYKVKKRSKSAKAWSAGGRRPRGPWLSKTFKTISVTAMPSRRWKAEPLLGAQFTWLRLYQKKRNFSREDVRLLSMFASQAAVAITRCRPVPGNEDRVSEYHPRLSRRYPRQGSLYPRPFGKGDGDATAIAREMHLGQEEIRVIQYAKLSP